MNLAPDHSLNPSASPSLHHIGQEREPLLQIDDLLRFPDALVDYAASEVTFVPAYGPGGGYPGIRAPAPLDYVEAVVRGVDPLLRDAFGIRRAKLANVECNFSLVTLPPEALLPSQRIPHVDTTYPLQFAFLHYLCPPEHGGTAFFRHRATGFEALTPERAPAYKTVRAEEEKAEAVDGYIRGDTENFEQIHTAAPAYNRLVIYRSRVLHSGQVARLAEPADDPRRGRLTANLFVSYRA
ncbi:MAG: hypothetical protein EOP60_03105 [Sphingomonadales bacterium]|nr:MAG: hypothetical protein EOP60_03105 [Sphingomonadales bacterium]